MIRFSMKSLLFFTAFVALACLTVVRANLVIAILTSLVTTLALVTVTFFAVKSKRALLIVASSLTWAYLIIADGGLFPGTENWLPTEWSLEKCCAARTYLGNGMKPPISLTQWMWQQCKPVFRTGSTSTSSPAMHTLTIDNFPVKNVNLPKFTFVTATTTITITNRFYPENKPQFLIGHCWFAALMTLLIFVALKSSRRETSSRTTAISTR